VIKIDFARLTGASRIRFDEPGQGDAGNASERRVQHERLMPAAATLPRIAAPSGAFQRRDTTSTRETASRNSPMQLDMARRDDSDDDLTIAREGCEVTSLEPTEARSAGREANCQRHPRGYFGRNHRLAHPRLAQAHLPLLMHVYSLKI
jgi:hypothetical protein